MHCENCGAVLPDPTQKFCPSCGILLKKTKQPLYKTLDSDRIMLFVDEPRSTVWLWHGSNTTTRMKFIAAKSASKVRDKHGPEFKIVSIDEGSEPLEFKKLIGLD